MKQVRVTLINVNKAATEDKSLDTVGIAQSDPSPDIKAKLVSGTTR